MSSPPPFADVPPAPSYLPSGLHSPSSSLVSSSHPHRSLFFPSHWSHLPSLTAGAGPFVTRLVHQLPSGHRVFWESRKHRKRRAQHVEDPPVSAPGQPTTAQPKQRPPRHPWRETAFPFHPWRLAYWTAVLFDIGSLCFVFSSICEFIPGVYDSLYLDTWMVGWVAFIGSVFFTLGSVFGVAEVIKAPLMVKVYPMAHPAKKELETSAKTAAEKSDSDSPTPTFRQMLRRLDFWVTSVQLVGALAFNINTAAFSGSFTLTQPQLTGLVDFCDVFASCCFTLSGYLSIMEVTHSFLPLTAHPLNDLTKLDMHITWTNFLGGIGFVSGHTHFAFWPFETQRASALISAPHPSHIQLTEHLLLLSTFACAVAERHPHHLLPRPRATAAGLSSVAGLSVVPDRLPPAVPRAGRQVAARGEQSRDVREQRRRGNNAERQQRSRRAASSGT